MGKFGMRVLGSLQNSKSNVALKSDDSSEYKDAYSNLNKSALVQ